MDYDIAKKIMDEKPAEAAHIYIDQDDQPRDKHIENLFRDAYSGAPLDECFRINFEVFFQELTDNHGVPVPRRIFIDADTAHQWVNANIGTATVRPMTAKELDREGADPEGTHLRYVAAIKSPHCRNVKPVFAPSALHAVLLTAIMVYRGEATKRLRKFFRPALRG